jgi:hypothetical protein
MKKKLLLVGAFALLAAAIAMVPVGGGAAEGAGSTGERLMDAKTEDTESAEAPGRELDLLFIHHSVGGQLLAPEGPDVGTNSIYDSFPGGGGLRDLLAENGYRVHEASYGSGVGEHTDLFDWLPKFRDHMDEVLRIENQDTELPGGRRNNVVMFKSCFPNSKFVGRGEGEGNPAGPELTLANAKATMRALLPLFAEHPDTLFLYVTAPPLAPKVQSEPMWKWAARKVLGRSWGPEELARSGEIAGELNRWLTAEDGWLADYEHDNVAVFDYWYVLTGEGESNLLVYPTRDGYDAHPALEGQRRAAPLLVETLNRAVRRAGLAASEETDEAAQEPESEESATAVSDAAAGAAEPG